ncbi:MAG: serine/threonine protein kinase, partial [Acidobacteria bacterium]|nr:serine/threonine protein kinase [Acidobacteriota bacterium]
MSAQGITEIVADAIELEGEERTAYLDRVCGKDGARRAEVDSLLMLYEQEDDDFLETPAAEQMAQAAAARSQGASVPERIANYRLLRRLGEGGMGTVYLAEMDEPVKRRVALKVVRVLHSNALRRRFAAECQALARLSHPNIAALYEVGTTDDGDGLPYLAMELADGPPITEWCDRKKIDLNSRLRLFLGVCAGIKHAHEKGVLHCDLKPSNVLVTSLDGQDVAKVIDFGIARALDEPLLEDGQATRELLLGSPPYISPEALSRGGRRHLDARTDFYSLGLLLYELVTGALPFDSEDSSLWTLLRRINDSDPPSPSSRFLRLEAARAQEVAAHLGTAPPRLGRRLRGDLDAIILRAIDRDPDRRYGSPSELAADIERHLGHRPIEARPPSALYVARRFARRHGGAVAAAVL